LPKKYSPTALAAEIKGLKVQSNHPENAGSDFALIRNDNASASVPRGWLPAGYEYWREKEVIHPVSHPDSTGDRDAERRAGKQS
jgi:hypothetical protein